MWFPSSAFSGTVEPEAPLSVSGLCLVQLSVGLGRFYNWSHPIVMAPTHSPSVCIATAVPNILHLSGFLAFLPSSLKRLTKAKRLICTYPKLIIQTFSDNGSLLRVTLITDSTFDLFALRRDHIKET